jgi:hypothetical protein
VVGPSPDAHEADDVKAALDDDIDDDVNLDSDNDIDLDLGPDSGPAVIANARRRHGAAGAIVAAGMFGLDQALGRKVKQEAPIVVSAPTEPVDVDNDGISVIVDDTTSIVAPALPRTAPKVATRRRPTR